MTITEMTFAVVVTGVGQHVVDTLQVTPGATSLGRITLLVPGAAIAADGCDCGAFVQAMQRINPTRTFPIDSSAEVAVACVDPSLMTTVVAVIWSCTPTFKVTANNTLIYPDVQKQFESALNQQVDAYVLRKAVLEALCAAKAQRLITAFKVAATEFPGPEGACKGVQITYSFQVV